MLLEVTGYSQHMIAKVLGISRPTVSAVIRRSELSLSPRPLIFKEKEHSMIGETVSQWKARRLKEQEAKRLFKLRDKNV